MENSKIFKKLVIVMLSLVLVAVCSTSVFATDDDLFLSVNSTGNTATSATDNNTASDNNTTNNTATNNTNTNNTTNSSLTANNTTNNNTVRNTVTNNTTNNTSKTNNSVNTLAKTGLSDTNGIVALIVIVCGVSAIYSYKKVNDYKKL